MCIRDRAGSDGIRATGLISVIVMNSKDDLGIKLVCAAQQLFEHQRMGVVPHCTRELDNDRRSRLGRAAKQTVKLFEVTHNERTERLSTMSCVEKLFYGNPHQ